MDVSIERHYIQLRTAQLRELVEHTEPTVDLLHAVFVELLFRERRAARELRTVVGERLAVLETEYFKWPTVDACPGDGEFDDSFFQYRQGLLGFVGYRVGASGVSQAQRQDLLDAVYKRPLPSLNSKEYMSKWGAPSTSLRLRKMAESIAAFARNAKRADARRLASAICEWESDLSYLKTTYYVGRYDFTWPNTAKPRSAARTQTAGQ